jgi:hypothetical protein
MFFTRAQGVTPWFVFYLIKEQGVSDAAQAAAAAVSHLDILRNVMLLNARAGCDVLVCVLPNQGEGRV